MFKKWFDDALEIVLISAINLRGNFKLDSSPDRDLDGFIETFLGRHAAQKSKIGTACSLELEFVYRHTVVYGSSPIHPGQRVLLSARNRNHWHFPEFTIERNQIW